MFNFIKLAVHQHCTESMPDRSRLQSLADLMPCKTVMSLAKRRYMEQLIALLKSLMNMLQRRDPKTDACRTPDSTTKDDKRIL